jgi:hypothetical protein
MVLTLEQYRHVRKPLLFLLALLIGLVALFISPDQMLLISVLLAVSLLLMAKGGERWNRLRIF